MRESRLSGSVEGVMSDHDSYSDFNLSSCKRISRATRLLPVWLHDATTDGMPDSGIMVQPDFLAINYEELCDTNPSKPTRAPWHARWTPSANGGLCSSSVMPSVAYGASPIFRRAWGWQRTSSARASRSWLRAESWNRCRLRTAVPTGNMP